MRTVAVRGAKRRGAKRRGAGGGIAIGAERSARSPADGLGHATEGSGTGNGLRVGVLGEVTATVRGHIADLGGPRQRAVLALLVIARGDVIPAERMIDLLWSDCPPPSAPNALQAYVSHLRRRLEPGRAARSPSGVIVREGSGYAFRTGMDAVDSWRFEHLLQQATALADPTGAAVILTEALALWRGPAFAGHAQEPWALPEATRLADLREVAREQLLAARLDCGHSAVLVPEIEALVAEEPLREERWRLLALALYRSNRQADALAALRRARHALAEELGVDPGPALRTLEAEILAQSPTLDTPAPAQRTPRQPAMTSPQNGPGLITSQADAPPDPPRSGRSAHDLIVDRDQEITKLRRCLADSLTGDAQLALVEGPAGIGKSRLLAEVRRMAAEEGVLTLTARGSQLEKEYAFGAVRQLLEHLIAARGSELLTGAAASAATVFDVATSDARERPESFAVLHGLYWVIVNLAAQRPLVLAIDDVQWCDTGSLQFLAYLVRRLERLPILIAATLRTGEPHADEALLAEIAHDPVTMPIHPSPLSISGVADLVGARLGGSADEAFVAACHRTTSGNPLLLRQLLRALESEGVRPDAAHADTVTAIGSRAVSSMVLLRLARLPAVCTAVARAIAVLGDGATLPILAALTGMSDSDGAAAVAPLVRAEVVREEYPLGFVHPLVADAVYRDLPPGERQLHHERAARVLDTAGAAPEQIAAHLLQVDRRADPWVVEVLRKAAATAAGRGALDAATAYLTRALAEPPTVADKPAVLLELGRVETTADGPTAVQHLRDAYDTHSDPAVRAEIAQLLARALVFAGEPGAPTAFAQRALAEIPAGLVDERQGLQGLERISGYMHGLDPVVWRTGDFPTVVGERPGARMLAADLAWEALIDGVDRGKAVSLARFALDGGVLMDIDAALLGAVAGVVLQLADEDTARLWDDALTRAHRRGSLWDVLAAHLWRGHMEWNRGDLREAHQSFLTSIEQSVMWGNNLVGPPYGEGCTIRVLLDLGDVAGARAFLEQIRDRPRLADGARLFGEAQACVLMAEGRYAEALTSLDEVRGIQAGLSKNPAWWKWRSLRATALAGLGRRTEAIALAEEELALARAWGAPTVVGRTLRILGELRGAEGVANLDEAVTVLAPTAARLEYARALYARARCLPGKEAVPLLRQAHELAGRCGAGGLYRSIATDLGRVGVSVPTEPEAAATLTTTERRIGMMFADGADDREIAQALFLTPQSVRSTLESLRERLGAASRGQLRQALTTAG